MKRFYIFLILSVLFTACAEQKKEVVEVKDETSDEMKDEATMDEVVFDSIAAARFGADDYGMKQYVMAFLKKGPNRDLDSAAAVELQRGHMANIKRMANEGSLVLAGPFLDDGDLRGIYIFNVTTIEEAQALTETDPAIEAGSLVMELHPWYGSAALMDVSRVHKQLAKVKF